MQGGTAQNKKRIIILSLILALAFVLPSFATVKEYSGNGFVMYGGVSTLSIDSVWTDEISYPYASIFLVDSFYQLVLSSSPLVVDSSSVLSGEGGPISVYGWAFESPEWVFVINHNSYPADSEVGSAFDLLWASYDLMDVSGDIYLPYEAPVSLDGYNVIEWDGVSDALPIYSFDLFGVPYSFTRVSDLIPLFSHDQIFSVYNSSDGFQGSLVPLGGIFTGDGISSISRYLVSVSSAGSNFDSLYPNYFPSLVFSDTGLYFSSSSYQSAYTHLFAYREAETEGPTGAVTGLTITNPPSGTSDFIFYAGSDLQCSAEVTGTGDFSSAVSWSVSHGSIGEWYPTISETGLLHVPVGTPEQRIFVTCTSVSDPTFSQTVPVYIMPPAVSSVTITPSSATAAPGQNIQFSATVSGSNVQDPDVTWSVGAATSPSTRISRDGLLLIGSDETSPLLGVRATSNQDGSVYSTALVTISVPAAVTGVTISPDDIVLNRGDTQQFTATVTGTGSFDSSVTWQITSVFSAGTSISANGLLTVSDEQEYDYIIIKATSTADPSFSATAYVFVEDALSDPMTIDLSVVERLLEEIKNYLKTLQHIFDRPHYFREFNMYTGKLNETEEQITGLTFNFYRFMQNMEEYVGSIAYSFANGAEVQIREDTTEGFDWFSLFFGKNSSSKVEKTDFAGVSTLVNHTRDVFDTGFGFSDFFDLLDTVPFFTDDVGSQLDTTTRQFDFRDPDPFNMSVLGNREDQLEEWRNKHTD